MVELEKEKEIKVPLAMSEMVTPLRGLHIFVILSFMMWTRNGLCLLRICALNIVQG